MNSSKDSLTTSEHDSSLGALRPTTSHDSQRYDNVANVKLSHMNISAGYGASSLEPEPSYLPRLWAAHSDPEGCRYFVQDSEPRVVTPTNIYLSKNVERLQHWLKYIQALLITKNIAISSDLELFMRLEEDDCSYYLVDHSSHKEFWLEELDTESLGLGPVVSRSHLDLAIEALYWTHVEQYSMHVTIARATLVDLSCILAHGQADHMTSEVSTFPFSRKECAQFSKLLAGAEAHLDDGRIVCLIARLRASIATNRFWTHHGQETARCSRDQMILHDERSGSECTWLPRLLSPVTLGISSRYSAQLEDAFTDRLVYKDVWLKVVTTNLAEWRESSLHACTALFLAIVALVWQGASLLPVVPACLLFGSIITSTLLRFRYEGLKGCSADRAHDHLTSLYSPRFRFALVSFAFALPKALYLWGLATAFASVVVILVTTLTPLYGFYVPALLASLLLLLGFVTQRATSEASLVSKWSFRSIALRGTGDDMV